MIQSMKKRNALQFIAISAIITGSAAIFSACSPAAPKFTAIDITGADYAKNFSLPDHNGKVRTLQDFQGKIVMMFFGYTQCPDVCPTSMSEMAEIKKLLGPDGDRLQGIFVSVDPDRDKPEKTKEVAKEYKVYYKKVDGPTETSYTVDHTAGSYVYDTTGKLRLFTRYGTKPELTAADLKILLSQAK